MSQYDDGSEADKKPHPGDAVNAFLDRRAEKAREIAIFLAENKIWQAMLSNCLDYSGAVKKERCEYLHLISDERLKYYNSNFNPACRPEQTPGLPKEFEFKGYPKFK